jgi:FkbM family methyltransferase
MNIRTNVMEPINYSFLTHIKEKESQNNYGTFIDIGSYTGDWIVAIKELFGDSSEIVAFEPDEENYKNNIERTKKYSNVTVHPVGIFYGKTESNVMISKNTNDDRGYVVSVSEHSELSKKIHNMEVRDGVTFKLVELEEIVKEPPFIVKMDVETSEYNIIKNSKIMKTAQYIMVEFHIDIGIPMVGCGNKDADKKFIREFITENLPTHKIVCHGAGGTGRHWRHVLLERKEEI